LPVEVSKLFTNKKIAVQKQHIKVRGEMDVEKTGEVATPQKSKGKSGQQRGGNNIQ